jgi:hypothetical protein
VGETQRGEVALRSTVVEAQRGEVALRVNDHPWLALRSRQAVCP